MADRYLLESGAPDGYLLEDGSGVLLLEGTGFDPSTGFPWPQPAEVPVHQVKKRATALLLSPLFKPPDQFVGAVRFVGLSSNNGLQIPSNLPGPTNFTVACFFYLPTIPGADASLFMLQDTNGTTPTAYINAELSGGNLAIGWSVGGFQSLGAVVAKQWYYVVLSVGAGGSANAYWGKVNAAPSSQALSGLPTAFTPASFTQDTDWFDEPVDGRLCSMKVWSAALSAGEAAAEVLQLAPKRTANVQQWWELKSAATKLVDSSGFGRNTTAIGAGTWATEEGPFLAPGPFDPGTNVAWATRPPDPVPGLVRRPWLVDGLTYSPLVVVAPSLTFWQPFFPDFLPRPRPPMPNSGNAVFAVPQWGTDWLSWLPKFPDRIEPPRRTREGMAVYTTAPNVWGTDWLSWAPTFPDQVRAKPSTIRYEPFTYAPAPAYFNVPPLSWLPSFPDQLRRAAARVDSQLVFVPVIAAADSPPLAWLPSFPDMIRRAQRAIDAQPGFVPLVPFVPALSWLPSFPDVARRAQLRPESQLAFVPLVAGVAVPPLSWAPTFPDFFRRAAQRFDAAQSYVPAINKWGTDFLSWLPSYPDRVPAPRRTLEGFVAYVPAVNRWGLDGPPLNQQPDVFRRARSVALVSGAPFVFAALPPIDWFVQTQMPVRGKRPLGVGQQALVQLVAPVVVPTFIGASPMVQFPPRLWVARLVDGLVEPFTSALPVLPFTFGGAAYLATPVGPTTAVGGGADDAIDTTTSGGSSIVDGGPAGPSDAEKP